MKLLFQSCLKYWGEVYITTIKNIIIFVNVCLVSDTVGSFVVKTKFITISKRLKKTDFNPNKKTP